MNERQLNYLEGEISSVREQANKQADEFSNILNALNKRLASAEARLNWTINIAIIAVVIWFLSLFF